jgi:hypothetical protein
LTQESTQVADLTVHHDWPYGKGSDGQSTHGYSQGYGDETSQGTRQHPTHRHDVMGHPIETHDAASHVVWD